MEKLEQAINNKIKDGGIVCKDAFEIAEELGIKPGIVGKKIDEMKIKIRGCQLGCF